MPWPLVAAVLLALPPGGDPALAEEPRWPLLLDGSAAYYVPTDRESRNVHSVFGGAFVGTSLVPRRRLTVYGGLMATGAWGSIVQLGDDFEALRFTTRAGGAGPGFILRGEPLQRGRVSLRLEIAGSALFYRPDFPPGGDFYNFAWQLGGGVGVRVTDRLRVALAVRWMHVSNGQGLGPHNPSYEGVGFPLSVDWSLPAPGQRPEDSRQTPRSSWSTARGSP